MNLPHPRCIPYGAALVAMCASLTACGGGPDDGPTNETTQGTTTPESTANVAPAAPTLDAPAADPPAVGEAAAAAQVQDTDDASDADADGAGDAQETASNAGRAAPADGPPALIVLAEHELLRSEQRFIDRVVARFARSGVTLRREAAGERAGPIGAWLDELDSERRAAQRLSEVAGTSEGVLVLRFAPPTGGRTAGVRGFGVLVGQSPRELIWSHGGALNEDALTGLARLFAQESP